MTEALPENLLENNMRVLITLGHSYSHAYINGDQSWVDDPNLFWKAMDVRQGAIVSASA